MKPVFALVDCNNFFASCERAFRPDLWDKPVAVLSNNDGCVVARSNEVKALGVPMAVPYFKVKDLFKTHDVNVFSGNFRLYGDMSQRIVRILQHECPDIEVYSVDESFLELSHLPITDYVAWAQELRAKIYQWTGMPVSIGIGHSKTLAKAAADFAKKNPQTAGGHAVVPDQKVSAAEADQRRIDLLTWLSVGDIWGVGWRTAPKLHQIGIKTAYDLSRTTDAWAQDKMTIRGLKTVKELRGESCIPLDYSDEPQKSIARTRSFPHSVRNYYELEGAVATFAAKASAKLRDQKEVAGAVMTFLRGSKHAKEYHGNSQVVRLMPPSADTGDIITAALQGLNNIYDPDLGYRRGGVVLLDLKPVHAQQMTLDTKPATIDRQRDLMQAIDQINDKYHTRLVRHASEHLELSGWHSARKMRSPEYTTNWLDLPKVKAA